MLNPDKTYVVTGGLGRVGSAIWPTILKNHGRVVVTTRSSARASAFNAQAPEGASAVVFSPVARADGRALWQALQNAGHSIGGLVNNAMGTIPDKPLEALETEDWHSAVKVDLSDMVMLCETLVEIAAPAAIVNVSSIYGAMAPDFSIYTEGRNPPSPIYAATKAAQLQLTRHLAVYWAERGVRVNAVCLGGVKQQQAKEFYDAYSQMVPQRRMIEPREAADTICYLLSDRSSALTGETLFVDGGRHAW